MGRLLLKVPGHENPVSVELTLKKNGDELTAVCLDTSKALKTLPRTLKARLASRKSNQGVLELNGQIIPYYTTLSPSDPHRVQIWIQGQIYEIENAKIGAKRAKSGSDSGSQASGDLKSSMPGKVLKIEVAVGDKVALDDTLVIMESMKMEMSMTAPFKGTVKEVKVAEGDLVEMNTLLIALEPEVTNND